LWFAELKDKLLSLFIVILGSLQPSTLVLLAPWMWSSLSS